MSIHKADGRPLRLGDIDKIADALGITRQAAGRALKKPGAPAPLESLTIGDVYDMDDIDDWAAKRRGPGRPRRQPGD